MNYFNYLCSHYEYDIYCVAHFDTADVRLGLVVATGGLREGGAPSGGYCRGDGGATGAAAVDCVGAGVDIPSAACVLHRTGVDCMLSGGQFVERILETGWGRCGAVGHSHGSEQYYHTGNHPVYHAGGYTAGRGECGYHAAGRELGEAEPGADAASCAIGYRSALSVAKGCCQGG